VVALFFVLRSPTLQRWGKPMATLPKFANPYDPDNPNPDPVSFYIEHAPEDEKVAREMAETLKEYGHPQVDTMEQAKAVFVLISTFKTDTEANPQEQVVYPVYIQTADIKSKDLRRIQWIDFRNGVRDLHEIAQLLPDPAKLLKALGIRPMGRQLVLPSVIQYLMYFIIALAIFTVGSWLPFLVQYLPDILDFSDADVPLVLLAINLIVFVALSVLMFRALIRRKGWPSSVKSQIMSMLVLGGLVLWQLGLGDWVAEALGTFDVPDDFRGFSSFFPPVIYFVGNFIMLIFSLRKRREINRWFPSKVKK
jgi:hypothetical protein